MQGDATHHSIPSSDPKMENASRQADLSIRDRMPHLEQGLAVAALCKYNSSLPATHETAAIRALGYLKTTAHFGLRFNPGSSLQGFADSDWAGCRATRKLARGHVFLIGVSPVTWQAKGLERLNDLGAIGPSRYVCSTDLL